MPRRKMVDFVMHYYDMDVPDSDRKQQKMRAYDETDVQVKFSNKYPRRRLAAVERV